MLINFKTWNDGKPKKLSDSLNGYLNVYKIL